VVELVGGVLLIAGLATRIAALVLAGDMVGAILVSGIGRDDLISLTLAPVQLAGMLQLSDGPRPVCARSPSPARAGRCKARRRQPQRNVTVRHTGT
jgi:hypothetical protein